MSAPDPIRQEVHERNLACATMVLEGAADGPTQIGVFTDEDITALDGLSTDQLVPMPWLTDHADDVDRDVAASVALRGLIARRLVLPAEQLADSWEDLGDNARRLYAADPVQGIITLRRSASAIATFQRMVQDQIHTIVYYLFDDSRALEEEITADGFHHFSIMPTASAPPRAQFLIDQDEVAQEDGEPVRSAMSQIEQNPQLGPVLADTRALTVATVVRRDGTSDQYSFYATSDRVIVSRTADDATEATEADADAVLTFVEASTGSTLALVAEMLDAPETP